MNQRLSSKRGITLISLIVTIVILLILAGVAIASLNGENGLFANVKLAKQKYAISEAKEKLELKITELRIEEEGKGETLTKEDLPKLNNEEIDVGSTENFPVAVICGKYKFNVDENFIVTYVGEADGTIITYTTTPEGYTNQDEIQILIKISNPKGIKEIEYPDGDKLEIGGTKERGIDYTVTANGTYTFKVIDSENNEVIKDVVKDQIDKLEPLDFTISYEKTENVIKVIGETQDAETDVVSTKSGIDYYEYYLMNVNTQTEYTKYDTNEIIGLSTGTYKLYVIAYDRAKNQKISNTLDIIIIKPQVVAGMKYSLAIDSEGNLWAWGKNNCGQLGDGTTTNSTVPVLIKKGTKFCQISAGANHSLAIDSEGNLWAWGNNDRGELGNGKTMNSTKPIQIMSGTKFSQISAGYLHSLAIDSEGNLWAWGYNYYGQLGNGTTTNSASPTKIKDGTKFIEISAGENHSLAIDSEGNLWAWGQNNNGQLGNGTLVDSKIPIQVKNGIKFNQISKGSQSKQNLAIDSEGNLWVWGYNYYGQLGNGTITDIYRPEQIKDGTNFKQISTGFGHTLLIDYECNLWTVGYNEYGQLGNESVMNNTSLTQIKNGIKFKSIAAGDYHSLAIDNEGNIWTWGRNDDGQLGDGTTTNSTIPIQITVETK